MAGELVVADKQIQLRGWLGGPGTSCDWSEEFLDWWGSNDVRTYDVPRSSTNGVRGGRDLFNKQVLTGSMFIVATTQADLLAQVSAVKAAWAVSDVDLPLVVQLLGQKWRRYGRPRRIAAASQVMSRFELQSKFGAYVTFQFDALDPLIYGDTQHSVGLTLPVAGGAAMPMTLPVTLAASTSNVGSVPNAGTAPAPWSAVLAGPLTNPAITLQGGGGALSFNVNGGLVIGASEYVLVDSATKSVLLNGTADRRNTLNLGSQWFSLAAGANAIQFDADAGSGSLTISWRDAYY